MEPVTLGGIAIVAFGLWIECEAMVARFARSFRRSNLLKGMISMATAERKPVFVNRYVPYSPR